MKSRTNRFSRILIVNEDGHVLAVRQKKGVGRHYCFPGGKVESYEHPKCAAVRELFEELGIRIFRSKLKHVLTAKFNFDGELWEGFYYACQYNGQRPTLLEYPKVDLAKFFPVRSLAELTCDKESFVDVAAFAQSKIASIRDELRASRPFA